MSRQSAPSPRWKSWTGLVYYGETLGFVAAWAAGVAILLYSSASPTAKQPPIEQVAVADELRPER